jgi:membrane protease YdiL (CAAX protease family)
VTSYALVQTAILAVLAFTVAPRRAAANVAALRRALPADPDARVRLYQRYALSAVVLTAAAAGVVVSGGRGFAAAGLTWPPGATSRFLPVATFGGAGFLLGLLVLAPFARRLAEPPARVLLPVTERERAWWPAVAIGAGVSEEAVYRGLFVLHAHAVAPSLRPGLLAVGAAVLFAAGHRYQGWTGVVASGLIGMVLGAVAVATASLYGAMLLHAGWDLLVGYAGNGRTRTS